MVNDPSSSAKNDPATDEAAQKTELARLLRNASFTAGALGVVLSPIPLADELILVPVYGVLTAKIARSRGVRVGAIPWRPIALTAVAGLAARAAINLTVSYIPGVAAVANAASAVALTRFFGRYVDEACLTATRGGETSPLGVKDFAEAFKPKGAPATA